MIRQIVVLAGGMATRLYPLTKTIPKSMVPIAGEPFFAHQLRLFQRNGIEEVVMCVGHLRNQIIDYFGNGKKFNISIVYSQEEQKLDTGGALKHAKRYLDDVFFTIYGDSYLLHDFEEVAKYFFTHHADGLMSVYQNNNQFEPSRVVLDGMYVKMYRKAPPPAGASFMEYGLNILKRSILSKCSESCFPVSFYFDFLTARKKLLAFPVNERFYEIGSKEGLAELDQLMKSKTVQYNLMFHK